MSQKYAPDFDQEMKALLEAIVCKYDYDFRQYSLGSMRRRLTHAMGRMNCQSLSQLKTKVLLAPESFYDLLQHITVPVSEMFRDPTYFRSLRDDVIPILRTYPSLKIWVAGCSTGEEVYSLAILLHEEGLLERAIIYATDINQQSLEKAALGVYDIADLQKFTLSYQQSGGKTSLSSYYTAAFGSVKMDSTLKKNITFADHSLATDAVFSEVHLVSCRNVLIYFNRVLQDRAFGLFASSLCRKGFLGLGAKETLQFSKYADEFVCLSEPVQIYQKHSLAEPNEHSN